MSGNIIQLNEDLIKNNLKDLVRDSVEETLNTLLDHEANELVNAEKYERSGDRKGYRSGHYDRNFTTTSGDVTLHVPKLKGIQFETAIIERYRRRECSVEESTDRDVPGRCISTPRREHHRSSVGNKGLTGNDQQPQQEGLRTHRGMAHQTS